MTDAPRRFTREEIEKHADLLARGEPFELLAEPYLDEAAAMLRQLLGDCADVDSLRAKVGASEGGKAAVAIREAIGSPERFETIHELCDEVERILDADHIGEPNEMIPFADAERWATRAAEIAARASGSNTITLCQHEYLLGGAESMPDPNIKELVDNASGQHDGAFWPKLTAAAVRRAREERP